MENRIEKFDPVKHFETLCNWLNRHTLPNPEVDSLSDFGLVVDDTAIGFLFKTNSKTAYIDNIVTNPSKTKVERNAALSLMLKEFDLSANAFGYNLITCLSNTETMDKRLYELGYRSQGAYSLYYKQTSKE